MRAIIHGGADREAAPLGRLLEQCGAEVAVRSGECCDCDLLICLSSFPELQGRCRMLLLDGQLRPPAGLQARCAVSCGCGQWETVTFSGLRDGCMALALRRELVDLYGRVWEQGEFIIRTRYRDPQKLLIAAAAMLALGKNPGKLGDYLDKLKC